MKRLTEELGESDDPPPAPWLDRAEAFARRLCAWAAHEPGTYWQLGDAAGFDVVSWLRRLLLDLEDAGRFALASAAEAIAASLHAAASRTTRGLYSALDARREALADTSVRGTFTAITMRLPTIAPLSKPGAGRCLIYVGTQGTLATAHAAHPERFVHGAPVPLALPTAVWINKPTATFDTKLAVGADEVTTH